MVSVAYKYGGSCGDNRDMADGSGFSVFGLAFDIVRSMHRSGRKEYDC